MKLQDTFAVLKGDLSVETVDVSPTLYSELDARFEQFRSCVLVSTHEFSADWPTWERHPAGDEIVILLSGAASMVLKTDSGREVVELDEPGAYVVVPRNTWHTSRVARSARMLFIAPGEGTENLTDGEFPGAGP